LWRLSGKGTKTAQSAHFGFAPGFGKGGGARLTGRISPQEASLKAYIDQLNRAVDTENRRREVQRAAQAEAAANAAREMLSPLEVRVARLLAEMPPEVKGEGLSLLALQNRLRGRGRGHSRCHVGELGDAMRRLGFRRERRWRRGMDGFKALWFPHENQ